MHRPIENRGTPVDLIVDSKVFQTEKSNKTFACLQLLLAEKTDLAKIKLLNQIILDVLLLRIDDEP